MEKVKYIFLGFLAIAAAVASILVPLMLLRVQKQDTDPVFAVSEAGFPQLSEQSYNIEGVSVGEKTVGFSDGVFSILRFDFGDTAQPFTYSIPVSGADIRVKWQNYDVSPYVWESAAGVGAIPKATLFIETTAESLILSVPAMYYNRFDHKTIENLPEAEEAALIEEADGGYVIKMNFAPSEGVIGELWFYKCRGALVEWDDSQEKLWLRQDLYKNRRFCFDGYYFRTYESYSPYAENGFFRNPANFTGAQVLEGSSGSAANLGYAMTRICMDNQNSDGYWETGPMSEWLYKDYGIGYDFYDTRFCTDFARSLIYGYSLHGDPDFLEAATKYADFLIGFADSYGYTGGELGEGVLVPDYWSEEMTKTPHVSLNHQLNEISFLLELYIETGERKYRESAAEMLAGIENTAGQWTLEDKNLRYALMYDTSSNAMVDYPYLTYNDLFDLRLILERLGEDNETIAALMASKKAWMDENGISEYKK